MLWPHISRQVLSSAIFGDTYKHMRISNSFSEGEIQVLEFIVNTLLRGGSPNMATRHKEFASLCRKVMAMKQRVAEAEAKKDAPERSSVGTVAAASADGAESSVGTVAAVDSDDIQKVG